MADFSKAISCPACGRVNTQDFRNYNGYLLKRCNDCGFVFTAERTFSGQQYDDVYSGVTAYQMMMHDAHETYQNKKGYRGLWWFKRKAMDWIQANKSTGRLLDIGSGPGTFLMVARRDYGYEIQGVEPASEPAATANGYGVPTYCGTVEEFERNCQGKFDAITSFEVLEHVPDPLSTLTNARKLLRDDGVLVLSMPNLDDPYCLHQQITPAMPPIHINFFSRKSLGLLLARSGFAVKQAYTLPIPTSSVRNVYGKRGFFLRLPYLAVASLMGNVDGTTLLMMAIPSDGQRG